MYVIIKNFMRNYEHYDWIYMTIITGKHKLKLIFLNTEEGKGNRCEIGWNVVTMFLKNSKDNSTVQILF